jgi:hypothetical protein
MPATHRCAATITLTCLLAGIPAGGVASPSDQSLSPLVRTGHEVLQQYERNAQLAQQEQVVEALSGWVAKAVKALRPRHIESCWRTALTSLNTFDCRALGSDGHRRLALAIASCVHESAGKKAIPCSAHTPFDKCARKLIGEQWVSFEHAQRDVTAVCFATQLDAMVLNFSSSVADAAVALLDGMRAMQAVQHAQLAAQMQLHALQERAIEQQEHYRAMTEAENRKQVQALGSMATAMEDAASLSVANLQSSRALATGLGWLLTLRAALETALVFASMAVAAYCAARLVWWLAVTRRRERRRMTAMERMLIAAMRSDAEQRDSAVAAAVQTALDEQELRIMTVLAEVKAMLSLKQTHVEDQEHAVPQQESASKVRTKSTRRRRV